MEIIWVRCLYDTLIINQEFYSIAMKLTYAIWSWFLKYSLKNWLDFIWIRLRTNIVAQLINWERTFFSMFVFIRKGCLMKIWSDIKWNISFTQNISFSKIALKKNQQRKKTNSKKTSRWNRAVVKTVKKNSGKSVSNHIQYIKWYWIHSQWQNMNEHICIQFRNIKIFTLSFRWNDYIATLS